MSTTVQQQYSSTAAQLLRSTVHLEDEVLKEVPEEQQYISTAAQQYSRASAQQLSSTAVHLHIRRAVRPYSCRLTKQHDPPGRRRAQRSAGRASASRGGRTARARRHPAASATHHKPQRLRSSRGSSSSAVASATHHSLKSMRRSSGSSAAASATRHSPQGSVTAEWRDMSRAARRTWQRYNECAG